MFVKVVICPFRNSSVIIQAVGGSGEALSLL